MVSQVKHICFIRATDMIKAMDEALLDATRDLLVEGGFEGISLERVAERADRSRVTLWRQGVTKDTLVTGLLQRMTDDFQRVFWPVLNTTGPGRERLAGCVEALFEVVDRHLDLLAVSDEIFHWASERCTFPGGTHGFLGPFVGALELGERDKSLAFAGSAGDAADVVFNTACWGYVHLRARHRWSRKRARSQIHAVLLNGVSVNSPAP
jgi:AcrR family transcriptional regulator